MNKFYLKFDFAKKHCCCIYYLRLSQQLAITEVEFTEVGQEPIVREQFNINLSAEAIEEKEALRSIDNLLSKTALSSVVVCEFLNISYSLTQDQN